MNNSKQVEPQGSTLSERCTLLFLAVSLLIGGSFFSRHIFGLLDTHFQYSCLVYNPRSVRDTPPATFDYVPEDVSWDETRWYGRWTNQILRGEWSGANLESYARFLTSPVPHQSLWLRDSLGPVVLAGMARVPGSDVRTAFLVADAIFPAAVAFSLMLLCWTLRPSVSFAVATTSLILFFNWQDSLNFIALLRGARQNSVMFLRTPYPQISAILLFLFLLSLLRLVRKSSFSAALWVAILLTLNLLAYFYSWTFVLTFIGSTGLILLLAFFFPRLCFPILSARSLKKLFVALACGTGVSILLTLPVWDGMINGNPIVQAAFVRGSGAFGHRPDLKYSALLLLLMLFLFLWRDRRWANRWFAGAYLVASLLVLNIQTITGKTIQPEHWRIYYIQPLFLLFLADFLWSAKARIGPTMGRTIAGSLLALGIFANVYKLDIGARQAIPYNQRDPAFEQLLELLQRPGLRNYGFLSNDLYLNSVLPAFVIQKPILPLYHDPLSKEQLVSLEDAAARALDSEPDSSPVPKRQMQGAMNTRGAVLTFNTDQILIVLNRHASFPASLLVNRTVLLQNGDFIVLAKGAVP